MERGRQRAIRGRIWVPPSRDERNDQDNGGGGVEGGVMEGGGMEGGDMEGGGMVRGRGNGRGRVGQAVREVVAAMMEGMRRLGERGQRGGPRGGGVRRGVGIRRRGMLPFPQRPMRPRNAFQLYCNDNTRSSNGNNHREGIVGRRVFLEMEQSWQTAGSNTRRCYYALASRDRLRYEREMACYRRAQNQARRERRGIPLSDRDSSGDISSD